MTIVPRVSIRELIDCGAICAVQDGNHGERHPKASDYVPEGVPFVMSRNLNDGCLDLAGCERISIEQAASLRVGFAKTGDVLLTHKGTLGLVAIVPPVDPYVLLTPQVTYYRTNPELLLADYLRYAFQDRLFQAQMAAMGNQSTRPFVSISAQRHLEIAFPNLSKQRQIAAILSAFDDLIENNRRRVEVLEEMARAIYREWFVHFRFPGHEHTTFVDSDLGPIPEGWAVGALQDLAARLSDGDWIETRDQGGADYRLLQVSNIGLGCFRETGNFRFITQETFERLRCTEIKLGDILISRMPDPVGRAWLVDELECPAVTAVDVAILTPEPTSAGAYVVQLLNSPEQLARAETVATGTTRKRVTRRVLGDSPTLIPPSQVLQRFAEATGPSRKLVTVLQRSNRRLAEARDLLLPKLVTGQIDVSDLDLDAVVEQAGV